MAPRANTHATMRPLFTACDEPLSAPLDLEPRSPVVAARTDSALAELATVPASDLEGTTYS